MVHPRLTPTRPAPPAPRCWLGVWCELAARSAAALLAVLACAGLPGCFGSSVEEGTQRPLSQRGKNNVLTAEGVEEFVDGEWRKHGPFTFRNERGEVISEGSYKMGLEDGPWIQTYADGARGKGSFVAGKRSGRWDTFFANGAPQDSGTYTDGRRSGQWTSRRSDGTLLRKATFVDGELNGPTTYFLPDGQSVDTARTGIYRDGELQAPSRKASR